MINAYIRKHGTETWTDLSRSDLWTLVRLDGLDYPQNIISTDVIGDADGSVLSSSRLGDRQITLTLVPEGPAEGRRAIYSLLGVKSQIDIRVREGKDVDLTATGYVETVRADLWAMRQAVTATVLCTDPWLRGPERTETEAGWENPGQSECGCVITATCQTGTSSGTMTLNGVSVTLPAYTGGADTVVTIDSRRGRKSYVRNGTSIMGLWPVGDPWPEVVPGANAMAVPEGWTVAVAYEPLYGGFRWPDSLSSTFTKDGAESPLPIGDLPGRWTAMSPSSGRRDTRIPATAWSGCLSRP